MKKMAGSAILALALMLCGCHRSAKQLPSRATAALQGLVRFRPPADQLLTDAQLDRYVRVRRAARGRTDVAAARAVAADLDEYAWVRARVIEALVALDAKKVRAASEETYTKTIAALRRASQNTRDRSSQRVLEEQIAGLERERASLKQLDATPVSVSLNAKRVAPRRTEIEALAP